jgi:hypothetical protein
MNSFAKSAADKQFNLAAAGQGSGCAAREPEISGLVQPGGAAAASRAKEPFSVQRFLLKYGLMTRRKPVREG